MNNFLFDKTYNILLNDNNILNNNYLSNNSYDILLNNKNNNNFYDIIDDYYLYYNKKFKLKKNLSRTPAYDDVSKKNKTGIYRVKYFDENDKDKKGEPKIKFKYYYAKNDKLVSLEDQKRIDSLGLAPSYEDVWVSSDSTSKIQATGIDIKGRKQYRYNKEHILNAEKEKFLKLYKFIKSMPKFEEIMEKDLNKPLYSKDRCISVMFYIIKELNIRVGKEVYARTNKSYGITSLKKSHVKIDEKTKIAKFNFKAKSNKYVQYTLNDKLIVDELIKLMDLDGEKLFQFKNNEDLIYKVNDVDLNNYIRKNMDKDITVKDFRTYAANFYFIKALLSETRKRLPTTQKISKKNLSLAQENTAFYLRHTKSISKKSYTIDLIRNLYMNDPDYFITNKNKKPLTLLLEILKLYKQSLKK
jgi:DNA topoisomerase-1